MMKIGTKLIDWLVNFGLAGCPYFHQCFCSNRRFAGVCHSFGSYDCTAHSLFIYSKSEEKSIGN